MILFFQSPTKTVLAVEAKQAFSPEDTKKLSVAIQWSNTR